MPAGSMDNSDRKIKGRLAGLPFRSLVRCQVRIIITRERKYKAGLSVLYKDG
jgi:hypothetical protein